MRFLLLSLCVIAGLGSALQADAQQIRSHYRFIDENHSIGIFGGYLGTDAGRPAIGPENAPHFGVRYNLRFTGPLSGEAGLSLVPSNRQVLFQDTAATEYDPQPIGESSMNLLVAEAGLRFHLTGARSWRNLAPYVVGTGGLAADLTGRGELDESVPEAQRFRFGPSFAVSLGAGTDLFVSDRLSLRLEARNHIFRMTRPPGLRETAQTENFWTNNLGVTIGSAFHF